MIWYFWFSKNSKESRNNYQYKLYRKKNDNINFIIYSNQIDGMFKIQ